MRPSSLCLLPCLVLCLLLGACSSTGELAASVDAAAEPTSAKLLSPVAAGEGETYTLVCVSLVDETFIPGPDEMQAIGTEHAAFVDWLHENCGLIAAGPVVPPRGGSLVRQLMLFDSDQQDVTLESCCEGPVEGTGLYRTEASRLVTTADLSGTTRGATTGRGALRPYVIVTGSSGAPLRATFDRMDSMVLCQGSCTEGPFDGLDLAILDCTDVGDARLFMGEFGADTWGLDYHAWIGPVALSAAR